MRILWGDCILTRGLTESVLFAPKPRAEGSSPSALTTKFKSACTFDSKQSGGLFTH